MTTTATATATGAFKIGVPAPAKQEKKRTNFTSVTFRYPNRFLHTLPKFSAIRSLDPQSRGQGGNSSGGGADAGVGGFINQEDFQFVLKLLASSIAGGAGIKYGSILFPEMTKPNIVQALLMISIPVVVAIWVLIKQSGVEKRS